MTRYYKILNGDKSCNGGTAKWSLPRVLRPGNWMPAVKNPKCCERGYHVVTTTHLREWLEVGYTAYEVEVRGASDVASDKSAHAEARLLRRVGQWTMRKADDYNAKRKPLNDDYDAKRGKLMLRILRRRV